MMRFRISFNLTENVLEAQNTVQTLQVQKVELETNE